MTKKHKSSRKSTISEISRSSSKKSKRGSTKSLVVEESDILEGRSSNKPKSKSSRKKFKDSTKTFSSRNLRHQTATQKRNVPGMYIFTQLYLLQYKSWKLQFRKKVVTFFELILPVAFCLLMVVIRSAVEIQVYPDPTFFFVRNIESLDSLATKAENYTIAYTPKTTNTDAIMKGVKLLLTPNTIAGVHTLGIASEAELVKELTSSNNSQYEANIYVAGVVFENPKAYETGIPFNISYRIRCRNEPRSTYYGSNGWGLDRVFPRVIQYRLNSFSGTPNYLEEGFLQVEHALHMSVIQILKPTTNVLAYKTEMTRFPYPPYTDDIFLTILQSNLPLFILLCLIFFSLNIPKEVALEKEQKLKESMRMMGMANWLQWLSTFIKYFIFLFIVTFLMALILCPPFETSREYTVFVYADFLLIWLFFLLYAVSLITFCFMISVFFNKANSASAAGGILYFVLYIPYLFLSSRYDFMPRRTKLLWCLDFNIAMSIGMLLIGRFEATGAGVQWDTLDQPVTVDDNLSFGAILLMFGADSLIHLVIMWYVENVFPGTFGIPEPPYFFLMPSYWCGTKQQSMEKRESRMSVKGGKANQSEFFEEEPKNSVAGIQIMGLTKKFTTKGMKKTAVNDLSLNMYDGQITALLGHNGAGKTTTMFMLTGFIPPTSGTALVNGYDIRKDIANVRSSLGLCPQHDILFDNLTVEEHLYFFAKLKNCPSKKIQSEIDYYLKALAVEEKRKAFSKTLSGGQKRKLSVGIALIGDSKIVILDEPTSGMDPSARRHMWDVLQAHRNGRTMILSTHFMDEADHLGDRIAILADGEAQCCGSPLFLKKKYGAGYHMVMTKKEDCDVDKIHQLLTKHVPEAKLESNVGAELAYVLPDDDVSAFPQMFAELETNKDKLGILGFGASVTTMEEVFMKVGEKHALDEDNQGMETTAEDATAVIHNVEKNTGIALFGQQFKAMFYKRVIYTWRNKVLTLSQILLPILFTALTILAFSTSNSHKDEVVKTRTMNASMFKSTKNFYTIVDGGEYIEPLSKKFASFFESLNSHSIEEVDNTSTTILAIAERSLKEYDYDILMAIDYYAPDSTSAQIKILFNPTGLHAAPTALLYSDQALLKHIVNDNYSFTVVNNPLPKSTSTDIKYTDDARANGFGYSVNLMFGFSFLSSSFVFFLITERQRKVKHSQIVSGVKWYNFWLSTFTWDFINFFVVAALVVVAFVVGDVKQFTDISDGQRQPLYLLVLMMCFGYAILPNMYAFQYLFTGPASGYVALVFVNIITGLFPQLAVSILNNFNDLKNVSKILDTTFLILLPNYNMGIGLTNIYSNYDYLDECYNKFPVRFKKPAGKDSFLKLCEEVKNVSGYHFPCCKDSCDTYCHDYQENYFAWEKLGIGKYLFGFCLQIIFFWMLVIIVDTEILTKFFYSIRPKKMVPPDQDGEQDDDVKLEKERVLARTEARGDNEEQVAIVGLTKYFGSYKAVDGIYLSVPRGQCFGLLGVNGAGKTTTFKMLTGDETISGGTAYMVGKNVRTDIHDVQKSIGYCPQFDALIDQMTGEEMLYMYARLRGIPEQLIAGVVDDLLTALLLNKHRKKLTVAYSGGNKRKLSTAIALMGDPPIVFLDEPTTGMDPVARRMLWRALIKVRDSGKTLILTSHSMEECEALCTRMAIMVNGKYRCLGSTQHLKNKFGAGYTLIARVSYPPDGSLPNIEAVQHFVEQNFPGSILKDKHQNLVQYHIAKGDLTWAVVFEKLEANKVALQIEDYSVSQTTLEQVFINFARAQAPLADKDKSKGKKCSCCCFCCTPEYVVQQIEPAK